MSRSLKMTRYSTSIKDNKKSKTRFIKDINIYQQLPPTPVYIGFIRKIVFNQRRINSTLYNI